MKQYKTLKELTLMDRFLFAEAMDDITTFENFLSILLEQDIHLRGGDFFLNCVEQ